MNFLRIRVIINGHEIYTLYSNNPVVIPVAEKRSKIVATDGYHITKPLELVCGHRPTYLEVVCGIDNDRLIAGIMIMLLSSMVGVISEVLLLKILSFAPVFYFLFLFYIRRREFIQIKPV